VYSVMYLRPLKCLIPLTILPYGKNIMEEDSYILESTQGPFKYQPLAEVDAIRLLVLPPDSAPSDRIQCDLIRTMLSHFDTETVDNSVTLFYIWGYPTNTSVLTIDAEPRYVRKNLCSALTDLRDATKPTRL
jgi:hypothetical protein